MILKKLPQGVIFFHAVVVYCFTRDRTLPLLKKKKDHPIYPGLWGFPAGKVRTGENLFAAAKRELAEETGNKKSQGSIMQLGLSFPACHQKHTTGELFYFHAHMMMCGEPLGEISIDPDEHEKYLLVDESDILADKFNMIPDAYDNFRDSLALIRQVIKTTLIEKAISIR